MTVEIFTADELSHIEAYHWPGYVLTAVLTIVSPLMMWALVRFAAQPFFQFAERVSQRPWVDALAKKPLLRTVAHITTLLWKGPGASAALLFSFGLLAFLAVLNLPAEIYFGFIREHQYGMSTEPFSGFAFDWVKATAINAMSMSALTLGLYGLARRLKYWWLILGIIAGVAMLASTLADPYRNRVYVDQDPLTEGPLKTLLVNTMKSAGIDFEAIVVEKTAVKSARLQAYFAGEGPTRTIVLNDVLLTTLTDDEIVAAVAHEAGHVHEDRWLRRIGAFLALIGFLGFIEWLFRWTARTGRAGITQRADIRTLPMILLAFELVSTLADPIGGFVSRRGETAADRYALNLLHRPDIFESMLIKATRTNKMNPDPPWWLVLMGTSHPPMNQRIENVRGWAKENGG